MEGGAVLLEKIIVEMLCEFLKSTGFCFCQEICKLDVSSSPNIHIYTGR